MKVAILGYGDQGQTAFEYWSGLGNEVTICDKDAAISIPDGVSSQLSDTYLDGLNKFELIVRTPALHPVEIVKANRDVPNILDKVTTVTNEFFRVCPSKNIIGVTGTKGKGTTSSLIAKMLESSGQKVHLGGNIGIPPLELLKNDIKPQDYVVLELANFQLIDLRYSPHIAVCLMVVPEHLDWHTDYQEYLDAKKPLFAHQTSQDIAISFADNPDSFQIASVGKGTKIPYFSPPGAWVKDKTDVVIDNVVICNTSEIALLGEHNWQNICASITAVWQVTHDISAIGKVVRSLTGLEHRLEFVRELGGIKYYDDSFGTTPETAIVAIQAFDQPKILIVGGSDKGADFEELAKTIAGANIRGIIAIGDTGPKIAGLIRSINPDVQIVEDLDNMPEIVAKAKSIARPGDVVLLSTACASFGLFKDYKDRGKQFQSAVGSFISP